MEIIGDVHCSVRNLYDDEVVDKERFVKANLVETLKKKYEFTESSVPSPDKLEDVKIMLRGGKFLQGSSAFLIDKLAVGKKGLELAMWAKTDIVNAALDDIARMIEATKFFPNLATTKPNKEFMTDFKAKLVISTTKLLNSKYLDLFKEFSKRFEKEEYDLEIHPYSVGIAYVLKPNLQKLARKSLGPAELARSIKPTAPSGILIHHRTLQEFYDGIAFIESSFEFETTKAFVEDAEVKLRE